MQNSLHLYIEKCISMDIEGGSLPLQLENDHPIIVAGCKHVE